MGKLSFFQLGLILTFVLAALIGVALFATDSGLGKSDPLPPVVIWGTIDQRAMDALLGSLKQQDEKFQNVTYVEKDPRTYNEEFVNAGAAGRSPDLFMLSQEDIVSQIDKVIAIPFESYSERAFKNTFIEGGELFLQNDGIIGLPFTVDPLVMYWNRDILVAEGIASPPAFWDEFFVLSPKITVRDRSSNIVRSFVAFGEYRNVIHAKDILAMLILQGSNPIVGLNEGGRLVSKLNENFDYIEPPALSALRFYTEFSNPVKAAYSWNRALPDSRESFLAGDLALYIGYASELSLIKEANPNLNFDVALVPRSRDAERPITFGQVSALAISLGSRNSGAALEVAGALTSELNIAHLSQFTGLPPVRRDLLGQIPTDAVGPIFYEAALSARGWLDPDPEETSGIFQRMVESVLSGRSRLSEAVSTANAELGNILR